MTSEPTGRQPYSPNQRGVILAITGASGAIYSLRLLQVLLNEGRRVHLVISPSGQAVIKQELGLDVDPATFDLAQLHPTEYETERSRLLIDVLGRDPGYSGATYFHAEEDQVVCHEYRDMFAPIASGSFLSGGMVVCPCSGTTLSAIAHSTSGNLIQRAAEVQLKERRKLILVPRETPLSVLQLENMQRVSAAGAVVLPAAPGWYHGVGSLADLVDFVVARICDQLEIGGALIRRWGEE